MREQEVKKDDDYYVLNSSACKILEIKLLRSTKVATGPEHSIIICLCVTDIMTSSPKRDEAVTGIMLLHIY